MVGSVGWGFLFSVLGKTQSDLQDMGLPIYPRSAYGPNGPSFWAGTEGPGYCLGYTIPLGLASGLVSLFSSPHQLPPSPYVRNAWARAVTLLVSVAISTCLFGAGSVKALSPSCVL